MESLIKKPKYPKLEGVLASRGISYSDLANNIIVDDERGKTMSDQAIRRRMNGDVDFSLDEIYQICSFMNCNFSDIFEE